MKTPAKILLIAPHLRFGGSAQVMRLLARHLDRGKYDLQLCLIAEADSEPIAGLPTFALGAARVRYALPSLIRLVWKLKPGLLFSGMEHLNLALLLIRPFLPKQTKILLRQNATPATPSPFPASLRISRLLLRWLYPKADRIVCQNLSMAEALQQAVQVAPGKIVVLANPLDARAIRRQAAEAEPFAWEANGPRLVAVGRLVYDKGMDLLLEAFVQIQSHYPTAQLLLAGAGPCEEQLHLQVQALPLRESVHFLGQLRSPYALLSGVTLYVQPSRRDAMPNALLEAAALGLPIVATPASDGLTALLSNRPGVWLAAECTSPALASALLQAMQTLVAPSRYEHQFLTPFLLENSIPAYQRTIDSLLEERDR